jgi:hypothetical protein
MSRWELTPDHLQEFANAEVKASSFMAFSARGEEAVVWPKTYRRCDSAGSIG